MNSKIVICVLFIISATQALPTPNAETETKEPACLEKLAWYGEVLNSTKKMYDEYLAKLSEIKFSNDTLDKLNVENSTFQSTVAAAFQQYDNDTKNLDSVSNTTTKEASCQIFINNYKNTSVNLTESVKNLKINVLNITSHLEESKEANDAINKTLSKTVDFLFITNIPKHTFKNASILAKLSARIVEDGIVLEKEWKFQPNGELVPVEDSNQDYDASDLEDKDEDDRINKALKELEDDTDIKKAIEAAKQDDDDGIFGFGFATSVGGISLIVLAVIVGLVLGWLRSRRYSHLS